MKLFKSIITTLTLFSIISSTFSTATSADYTKITTFLKQSCAGKNIKDEIMKHFKVLEMANAKNEINPAFANFVPHSATLFQTENISAFIDRAATCWNKNPFFNSIYESVPTLDGWTGTRPELNNIVCSAICYAVALERVTNIVRSDYRCLDNLLDIWGKIKNDKGFGSNTSWFDKAKYKTVLVGLKKRLEAFKARYVEPSNYKFLLPLNVLEATVKDATEGNWDNARAGKTLLSHPPGRSANPKTLEGPTELVLNPNNLYDVGIAFSYAFPKEWDDLYQAWNLTFVMNYPNFPFFYAKLLNPAVACYQADPRQYIYNRGISLWMHANWEIRNRLNHDTQFTCNWKAPIAQKKMGAINRSSAGLYEKKVSDADPSFVRQLTDKAKEQLSVFGEKLKSSYPICP